MAVHHDEHHATQGVSGVEKWKLAVGVCKLSDDLYRKVVSMSGLQKHIVNYSPAFR